MIRLIASYSQVMPTFAAPCIALVVLSACGPRAAAVPDEPFSGRWRIDTTSVKGNAKPTMFQLINGKFKRDDNETVKADGYPHRITPDGYVDEVTVSIESERAVKEIDKIRNKIAYTSKYIVSADGNTLTWHVASYTGPDGQPVKADTVLRRVGGASNGSHLISGKWQRVGLTVDAKNDDILRLNGNKFSWHTVGGGGYDAVIGGASVQIDGDNSGARALITRPRPDLIIETDLSAKGAIDSTMSLQLLSDKKTIRAYGRYGPEKRWTTYYMHKQKE